MASEKIGYYYADYDEETTLWCVFHTDRNSGHAYSTHSGEDDAWRRANERNECEGYTKVIR